MNVHVLQRLLPALLKSAGLAAKGHFDEVPNSCSHRLRSRTWDEGADNETASKVA